MPAGPLVAVEGVVVHGEDEGCGFGVLDFCVLISGLVFLEDVRAGGDGPLLGLSGEEAVAEGADFHVQFLVCEWNLHLLGTTDPDALADGEEFHLETSKHRAVHIDILGVDAAVGAVDATEEAVFLADAEGVVDLSAFDGRAKLKRNPLPHFGLVAVEVVPQQGVALHTAFLLASEADRAGQRRGSMGCGGDAIVARDERRQRYFQFAVLHIPFAADHHVGHRPGGGLDIGGVVGEEGKQSLPLFPAHGVVYLARNHHPRCEHGLRRASQAFYTQLHGAVEWAVVGVV